jgi:protocatechuate 3,4-dioxygenase beta subunit
MEKPSRREVMFLLGSTAIGAVVARAGGAVSRGEAAQLAGCVVTPQQTEGPYFVDERLNRRDIRIDPSTGVVKAGVPLALTLRLSQVAAGACTPLTGALVDVWQCDALGAYSDVGGGGFNTLGQKFLRGYQVSDASGVVAFQTIVPGWYPGRAVHIHFKVRTSPEGPRGRELTSQLYFEERTIEQLYADAPYTGNRRRRTPNAADGLYRNGGSRLTLALTPAGEGFAGTFDVGVRG